MDIIELQHSHTGSHLQKSTQGLENQPQVVKLPSREFLLWGSGSTPQAPPPPVTPLRLHPLKLHRSDYKHRLHPGHTPGHTPHKPPLRLHPLRLHPTHLWVSLRSILFISNTITVSRTDCERTRTMYWKQYWTFVNIYMTTVSSHAARLRPLRLAVSINVISTCACVDKSPPVLSLTLSTFEVL